MSIASYSDLQTAIANWLNDSNLTSYIPDFISLAEARIYRELRLQTMVTSLSSTIASGVISVPSDFLEFQSVYVSDSPVVPLEVVTAEWLIKKYPTRSSEGEPKFIARAGSNFIFGPYPDSNYTIKGTYYQRLSSLASSSTNWFTTNAPDILLYASLTEAEPFIMNDERLPVWESKYQNAKNEIMREDNKGKVRGSPKMSRPR